jgi:formate hydrogenlyase regulatory protein HycA
MALPLLIRIAHEPDFRTKYIGRYADGQFYGDIHGTRLDKTGITVMLHLFDHAGRHVRSDIRPDVPSDQAPQVLAEMLAELPDVAFGDIAIRLFEVTFHGERFGLVEALGRGRDSAELYPQGLGFFPPFDGLYDT